MEGGRKWKKKDPEIESTLLEVVVSETAGDPMTEQKWVRSSLRNLGEKMSHNHIEISAPTISRLLKKHGYSLRVNQKEKESSADHPDRNKQFEHIDEQKRHAETSGSPIISVDTKKKELIGDFKNNGKSWDQEAERVNVHDFPSDAIGKAVPYGIYDEGRNQGHVFVGTSSDTPEFAVNAIQKWWDEIGRIAYPNENELLILGDSGGSNSSRSRVFKKQIQDKLCNQYGLNVTVCHYPRGCSKWNPIEHRLFSHISINWAGKPLRSFDTMLNYIRGTKTKTGLQVGASILGGTYQKGKKVSDKEMSELNLHKHTCCPQWNYIIRPQYNHMAKKDYG